ncbi:hypothetical protein ACH3VR_22145 [Microbacterium sp. B2969]|uniref:RNA polymerase sigma-70 region 4 domain-containing protein n=1 Tax=Microbacterium alkaliflavum TaxID=3248839 RepID=A0ABW7QDX4_9MICO
MNIDTTALRSRLRGLSATLKKIDDEQRALREEQLEQLRIALAHRGTVGEVAQASGLSRAYLHKIGLHLQRRSVDDPQTHDKAIARAGEIREEIAQLEQDAGNARAERDQVIRELGTTMSTAEIAKEAGISGERARLILQDAGKA